MYAEHDNANCVQKALLTHLQFGRNVVVGGVYQRLIQVHQQHKFSRLQQSLLVFSP